MIRELRDEDVPAAVRVLRAVHVAFVNTERSLRHSLAGNRDDLRHRYWVAEEEGEIVGRARAVFESFSSERDIGRVNVSVVPEQRRRGIGAALYAAAEEHPVHVGARRPVATADDPAGRPFLEARGFRHTHTDVISAVEPAAVDLADLPQLQAARAAEGLRVVPLASVRERPREMYELRTAALADVPTDTPFDDYGYEDWLRSDWSYPDVSDDSFVVLDGERPVSFAFLVVDPDGASVNAMTGTLRAYRGRGLARLSSSLRSVGRPGTVSSGS